MSQETHQQQCWLIIGAHLTGASENQLADMFDLPITFVRRIVTNFKHTGSPFHSHKPTQIQETKSVTSKESAKASRPSARRKYHQNQRYSTIDVIQHVLDHADRSPVAESKQKSTQDSSPWRLPTPPLPTRSVPASTPSCPPSILPPSPPLNGIHSTIHSKDTYADRDTPWTRQDDKAILCYIFRRLRGSGWKDVEARLEGRHSADACRRRWTYLRGLLFKALDTSQGTEWQSLARRHDRTVM